MVAAAEPEQYRVTRQNGTEPAFRNEYWDNKEPGLYVDVVSGEPLFASVNKYDSHTGCPSFTVPVEPGHVVRRRDFSHWMIRTEVRSARPAQQQRNKHHHPHPTPPHEPAIEVGPVTQGGRDYRSRPRNRLGRGGMMRPPAGGPAVARAGDMMAACRRRTTSR